MGWGMAGLELEHGSQRLELPAPSPAGLAAAEAFAAPCRSAGRRALTHYSALRSCWPGPSVKNVYLIAVRTVRNTPGTHPRLPVAPGGQAVQRSDDLWGAP